MGMRTLEQRYEALLKPAFGARLRICHDRDDFVTVVLDGDREEFFFTLYGPGHVRLYWCNECFIFDARREELVSSDTYGEIVYERTIDPPALPALVAALVLQLKDCRYLDKAETVRGRTASGYDTVRDYVVRAWPPEGDRPDFRLGNILLTYSREVNIPAEPGP